MISISTRVIALTLFAIPYMFYEFGVTAEAQETLPCGIITLHRGPARPLTTQCFVPILVEDTYLICTPITGGITSESKVGLQLDADEYLWTSLGELLEQDENMVNDPRQFGIVNSVGNLCILQLIASSPMKADSRRLWEIIRERSVQLDDMEQQPIVDKEIWLYSYKLSQSRHVSENSRRVTLGLRKESEIPSLIVQKPFFYMEFESNAKLLEIGGAFMAKSVLSEGQENNIFFGICTGNPDLPDLTEDIRPPVVLDRSAVYQLCKYRLRTLTK